MSEASEYRLAIDTAACRGHRQCVFVAPELVEIDDQGRPRPVHPALSSAQRRDADDAVLFCPETAISLEPAEDRDPTPETTR
jgi:ferredoxin